MEAKTGDIFFFLRFKSSQTLSFKHDDLNVSLGVFHGRTCISTGAEFCISTIEPQHHRKAP